MKKSAKWKCPAYCGYMVFENSSVVEAALKMLEKQTYIAAL